MSNNCKLPEMCLLSETCVPCAICPNVKEKADDRLARTACSEVGYYPPPNDRAAKIWPSREEQTRPCRICGQLPVMGLSSNGNVLTISHCFCPSMYPQNAKTEGPAA